MQENSTDEQELAKALDSVANLGQNTVTPQPQPADASPHLNGVQPIVPPDSPVAPAVVEPIDVTNPTGLPTIEPIQTPMDSPVDNSSSDPMADPPILTTNDGMPIQNDDKPANDSSTPDAPAEDKPADNSSDNSSDDSSKSDDTPPSSNEYEDLKNSALNELRPLVDKLKVAPEEKFDTLLLLIRSTDDKSLLNPTYEAAKAIEDETRRAQALLDVIKEIDYLTHKGD